MNLVYGTLVDGSVQCTLQFSAAGLAARLARKECRGRYLSLIAPAVPALAAAEGLRFEKREFWSCWSLDDQKEGMAAFVQKRKPEFKNK